MINQQKNFNAYFQNDDLSINKVYSKEIVKALVASVLEPLTSPNYKGVVLYHLNSDFKPEGLIKRLEYSNDIELKEFGKFEFSKFDVEEVGFVVLNSFRYNCAFLFKEVQENRYEIYLKLNSKLINNVYKTIKTIFAYNCDDNFLQYKPERRDNLIMNGAVLNLLNFFEETIEENEYSTKIQESYKTVNETNTALRNEVAQSVKQIAHEIKNQLSILDIYTRIFEKKTGDTETIEPIKKSISLIKSQIEQFKNIDVINLQERNIKNIIQNSIKLYSSLLKEKNNRLTLVDCMAGVEAKAFVDEEKFLIVVNNIIKNAHDSTQNDEIIIKIALVEDRIKISFINHGEQINLENQDKIFESGYTTKEDGWGVGLSVCKKFIGSQFGTFELEKSDENETIFSLILPFVESK